MFLDILPGQGIYVGGNKIGLLFCILLHRFLAPFQILSCIFRYFGKVVRLLRAPTLWGITYQGYSPYVQFSSMSPFPSCTWTQANKRSLAQ